MQESCISNLVTAQRGMPWQAVDLRGKMSAHMSGLLSARSVDIAPELAVLKQTKD